MATCRDYDTQRDLCDYTDYEDHEECVNGGSLDYCEIYRFLSVTCEESNGNVFIRFQSAGTPDYCWNTSWSSNVATAQGYDVTVSWNLSVSEITDNNIKDFEANSSQESTDILCKTNGTSWNNAPIPIDLTLGVNIISETYLPDTLVGFALNGVPFV